MSGPCHLLLSVPANRVLEEGQASSYNMWMCSQGRPKGVVILFNNRGRAGDGTKRERRPFESVQGEGGGSILLDLSYVP